MNFIDFFSKQAEKPTGLFGKLIMSRIFEKGNAELNTFMKELLSPEETDHLLEIGFGPGKMIKDLAAITKKGKIVGVDFSDAMVSIAQKRNQKHIANGRVKIHHGSFEDLSYNDNVFDKVYTVNTIYFWPDPAKTVRKIKRLLKPGGKLVIAFGDKAQLEKKSLNKEIFRCYSNEEVKDLLENSGFSGNIKIMSRSGKSFLLNCAVALKPRGL